MKGMQEILKALFTQFNLTLFRLDILSVFKQITCR